MPAPAPLRDKRLNLKDEARFIRSWLEKPLVTGAVSPSGRALARMMARCVDPAIPGPVLELGPGTGPVTEALIERGFSPARLFLIEFNPEFAVLLERRFPGVNVLRGDAYDVRRALHGQIDQPLNGVLSSLPLLTKPLAQRCALLGDCFDLGRPGAPFVQFTYAVTSPIPLEALDDAEAAVSPLVWWNLPPARVWTYSRRAR